MLDIYIPYALVVLATIALRAIPDADVKAVGQTIVLGPFTFIRPAVACAGLAYAFLNVKEPLLIAAGLPILCSMLMIERIFEKYITYAEFEHIKN